MRLIDADALKFDIMCVYGSNPQYINWLNHAPAVDAVEVVRCKDCFYRNDKGYCNLIPVIEMEMDDDDYCSRAERKEE